MRVIGRGPVPAVMQLETDWLCITAALHQKGSADRKQSNHLSRLQSNESSVRPVP